MHMNMLGMDDIMNKHSKTGKKKLECLDLKNALQDIK